MILSSHGLIASQITQFVGLLDLYPSAAAAYSLRKLRTAYTGSAIRVRRASDNTEQDIGFVGENLNTLALTTFCTGTNGFVKTWYDQSGNGYDATQTTAANQPQIVSSGSVIFDNGKSCVSFNGTSHVLSNVALGSVFSGSSIPISSIGVFSKNNTNTEGLPLTISNTTDIIPMIHLFRLQSNGKIGFFHRTNLSLEQTFFESNNYLSNTQYLSFFNSNGSNFNLYYQNIVEISNTYFSSTTTYDTLNIGALVRLTTSGYLNGKIQEIILYPSNQSSNRTGISDNINDFYSIY